MKKLLLLPILLIFLSACGGNKEEETKSTIQLGENETEILEVVKSGLTEDTTNYDKPVIEEQVGYVPGVKLKEGGSPSVAPEGTNFLKLSVRANETHNLKNFEKDTHKKAVDIVKKVIDLLDKHNISVVQIDFFAPSKYDESVYYILRFDTKTLKENIDNINENNILDYTNYISDDYKKLL